MLGRRSSPRPDGPPPEAGAPAAGGPGDMALDTVAGILRTLGEFALEQAGMETATFVARCEQWARHVIMAAPAPGSEGPGSEGRRDWQGVREFVRDYCRESSAHARTIVGDLRQVVWVFIQNLNQTFAHEKEDEAVIRDRVNRLQALAQGPATAALKQEVLETVATLSELLAARKARQHEQVAALGEKVKALGSELDAAKRESETDPLTGLYNRRAFDEQLDRSVEMHQVFGESMCLLLIDIDHFKTINDRAGHTTGDQVLRKVADATVKVFLRKNDFVARYGGDELAVLLRDTSAETGLMLADRLVRGVRALTFDEAPVPLQVTLSCGTAGIALGDTARSWLDRADRGLYAAKQAGRDRAAAGT